jgi:hypothetical protein
VSVPGADLLDSKLAPQIRSIQWFRVGENLACVTVNGKNFFTGTTAVMGDTVVAADNGLTIKSERTLQLVVPLDALLNDALLNGRYGQSIEMARPPNALVPLKITGVWIDPKPGNQSYEAVLRLETSNGSPINWKDFLGLPEAIFAINNRVISSGLQYDSPSGDDVDRTVAFITARALVAPDVLSATSLLIAVRWPFFGSDWSLHFQTYNSVSTVTAIRSASSDDTDVLLISGREFGDDVNVFVNQAYRLGNGLSRVGSDIRDVLKLELSRTVADAHRELLVWEINRPAVTVPIPPRRDQSPPSIDGSKKPLQLKAGTTSCADFAGTGLSAVESVSINGHPLDSAPYRDGTSISVIIVGEAIAQPGKYTITFRTAAGLQLTAPILVVQDQASTASRAGNTNSHG